MLGIPRDTSMAHEKQKRPIFRSAKLLKLFRNLMVPGTGEPKANKNSTLADFWTLERSMFLLSFLLLCPAP